jgi:hypothetical protein
VFLGFGPTDDMTAALTEQDVNIDREMFTLKTASPEPDVQE